MKRNEWTVGIIFAVIAVALLVGALWISSVEQSKRNRAAEFAGACKVLNGEVHDDLCIKGDAVVLDRAEFDKEK